MSGPIFRAYRHIDEYRQFLAHCAKWNYPRKLHFEGTVKLHGTNSAVCRKDGLTWYQSRQRIIDPLHDNVGFAAWAMRKKDAFDRILAKAGENYEKDSAIYVYGEFAGKGIQKGCAIHELDPFFAIFSVTIVSRDLTFHLMPEKLKELVIPEERIFNVMTFKIFEADVDLDHPEAALPALNAAVEEVERQCPVGKYFGVEGPGEGVVWTYAGNDPGLSGLAFKTKGEKYKKVKQRGPRKAVALAPEIVESIADFADYAMTEDRMKQGFEELDVKEMKDIGPFVKWCVSDALREESDAAVQAGLPISAVGKALAAKAQAYVLSRLGVGPFQH